MNKSHIRRLLASFLATTALMGAFSRAEAGATLDRVRSKELLRCGVSEDLTGFAIPDGSGNWKGMDADFCRAVAAAAGPNVKVEFIPLTASARFIALKMGKIDLLIRDTTWTLTRESLLGVHFAGVLYFDGQAFMVSRKSGIKRVQQLKGATICVLKATTNEMNLKDYSNEKTLKFKPLVMEAEADAARVFFAGRCRAFTADASQLASARLAAPGGAAQYVILPERISKEPTGPVVRNGDEEWLRLVKWVLFALIEAEERGVTQENAATMRKTTKDPAVRRLLGTEAEFGKTLGTDNDWALRAIRATGNYDEMFERNLGRNSNLKLERGYNRLVTQGGLLWSPPFR